MLWITKSHNCHHRHPIWSWCQIQTKGRYESHSLTTSPNRGHLDVVSTTKFLHTREGSPRPPPHRHVTTPHQEWMTTTPSSEGHKDLEHSRSPRYKGNTTLSLKALKLLGLTRTRMHYSVYPSLGHDLECLQMVGGV